MDLGVFPVVKKPENMARELKMLKNANSMKNFLTSPSHHEAGERALGGTKVWFHSHSHTRSSFLPPFMPTLSFKYILKNSPLPPKCHSSHCRARCSPLAKAFWGGRGRPANDWTCTRLRPLPCSLPAALALRKGCQMCASGPAGHGAGQDRPPGVLLLCCLFPSPQFLSLKIKRLQQRLEPVLLKTYICVCVCSYIFFILQLSKAA